MSASAPGAMPVSSPRTACEGDLAQPLVLDRVGYAVAGTVVDHFGGPISGARVLGDLDAGAAMAVTDDAGRFELWTGNGRLWVSATAYGSVSSEGPAPDPDRRVELYPEAAVEGTVRDGDGTARAGVEVLLRSARTPPQVTQTDAEGRFRYTGLSPGEFELRAVAEPSGAGPTLVRVPMGETVVRDLELEPRATLAGQVLFSTGEPCTDASLVRVTKDRSRFESQQLGAAAGEYSLAGLPPGSYALVAVCSEAASAFETTIELTGAEAVGYDVVFEDRAASISGIADVDEPTQWTVKARRAAAGPGQGAPPAQDLAWRVGKLAADGEFTLVGLGEGTWILDLSRTGSGRTSLRDAPGTEVVVGREDVTGVRLTPQAEHAVTIALVEEGGEAVRGRVAKVYRVDQYIQTCTTNDAGTCAVSLPGEPPHGELTVSVPGRRIACADAWEPACAVEVDRGPIELVVEGVTTLEGRLTEASDGSPLSFAQVCAAWFEGGRERCAATTRTDEDGEFVLRDLPTGAAMQLKVTCPAGEQPPIYAELGPTPAVACDLD